ncbi:hypothetical protein [Oceanobacillus sojae]|uniref:hypothetical protein n=1 Tax=Oceanobacillus sojae TaxID=582851 RepID=UPI0036258111
MIGQVILLGPEIHYVFCGSQTIGAARAKVSLIPLVKKKNIYFRATLFNGTRTTIIRSTKKCPLALVSFLVRKQNEAYLFIDGSGGKPTPTGKATGEDPAESGLLSRRLRRCPWKAAPRSGHLLGKNTKTLKIK